MKSREFEVPINGVLSLSLREDGGAPWWWYLDIQGQPLYHIGNRCGTCNAIFKRVQNATLPLTPQQLSEQLEIGFEELSQDVLETVTALLPKGRYRAELLTITPSLMSQENRPLVISCEADYFWISQFTQTPKSAEYEIILPIVERLQLDPGRIDFYKRKFETGLNKPMALAFSMHDERVIRGEYDQSAFVHFLLDGHHKVMAASEISQAVSLLSFTRLNTYAETWVDQGHKTA
jgi:hypothetical protein